MPAIAGPGRRVPLPMLLAAMIFPILMAFAYPGSYLLSMVDPVPRDMALEVIDSTDDASQIASQLSIEGDGAFDVSTVEDADTARADVLALDARAAYDPSDGTLYVASAGGMQATRVAQSAFEQVADQTGATLSVEDLRAPEGKDTLGIAFMYILTACLVGGYVTATMLTNIAGSARLLTKLLVQLIMSAVAAVLTTGILYGLFGIHGEHMVAIALIAAATFLTSSVVQLGLCGIFGQASTIIGIALFVVLGIPTTGIAVTEDLLPGFFAVLHRTLPSGASGELMRRVLYFDGVGVGPWILLLVTWGLVGAGLLWLTSLRAPDKARESVVAEGVEHVREHPDDPLLTAYERDAERPDDAWTPGPAGASAPRSDSTAPSSATAVSAPSASVDTDIEAPGRPLMPRRIAQEEGLA